jgi:sulfite exporter TauE/SafE
MLVAAWTLAAGAGGSLPGAAVMAVFAIASLPGLVVPIAARRIAETALRRLPRRALGAAWCVLAVWLVVRPLLSAVHQH